MLFSPEFTVINLLILAQLPLIYLNYLTVYREKHMHKIWAYSVYFLLVRYLLSQWLFLAL